MGSFTTIPGQTIITLYNRLKAKLDWIPRDVVELASQYEKSLEKIQKTIQYSLVNVNELKDYISYSETKSWDNLLAFLNFLTTAFQSEISYNSSVCVLSTEAVKKLKLRFLERDTLDDEYLQIHHNNCISLNFDNGKPFIYRGLYKEKYVKEGQLYYFAVA